jgi:hypothetical protein
MPPTEAEVDSDDRNTTQFSQSWRWPIPVEGSSLGMYHEYMMAQYELYAMARAYTCPVLELHPLLEPPVGFKPPLKRGTLVSMGRAR